MPTIRDAKAVWTANIEDGTGTIHLDTSAQGRFDRESRSADGENHNPETLAAGAQAGSYAMSLADQLAGAGFTPVEIQVTARVILDQNVDGTLFIPAVAISARAQVNNIDHEKFLEIADGARKRCPVATLFAGADVTLEADTIGG